MSGSWPLSSDARASAVLGRVSFAFAFDLDLEFDFEEEEDWVCRWMRES